MSNSVAKFAKLKEAKGKCEACGKTAGIIHSLDNNDLVVLCFNCNRILVGRTSAKDLYIKLYGFTASEIAEQFGTSISHIYYLHQGGILTSAIASGNLKRRTSHSKYRRLYGFSLKELVKKTNTAQGKIHKLHKEKKLQEFLEKLGFSKIQA